MSGVTDLAVELNAPIILQDFRTMNRCLDDAIASAVTEHARGHEGTRDEEWSELRNLAHVAMAAFEVLETGNVGIAGTTGDVLHRSLTDIRALADRQSAEIANPQSR